MNRRLRRHGPIALLCGVIVFVIMNLAAWYNLRGEMNVCRRQGFTRTTLQLITQELEKYQIEHEEFPNALTDVPNLPVSGSDPDGIDLDEWEHPIQYELTDSSFELFSLGRDGRPGGIGLDADIYHDGRNRELSLATFRQYFGESDRAEVDHGGFFMVSLIVGVMVIYQTFVLLDDLGTFEKSWSPVKFILYCIAIVCIASLVGVLLLPLHIPSGH